MNYEAQLDAARNAELNRYLDRPDYGYHQDKPKRSTYRTVTFIHELHGELLKCVMTYGVEDENYIECKWYDLNGNHLKYTNETAPFDGIDRPEVLAFNTWYDLDTYQRTLRQAA